MIWLLVFAILHGQLLAHSWNEQLSVISNGTFAGSYGYPRGYIPRSHPGFTDAMMVYLLPPAVSGRTRVNDSDILCAPSQRTYNQSRNFPRLQALPGSFIAMRYLENGHVTLPQNQPGKQTGSGTVSVFGTSRPNTLELLTNIQKWTRDGTGGDRRGKLLTNQNFDDGRCYQINDGNISLDRQKKFPNPIPGASGSSHEQWCETDVMIPANIPLNSTYTIYWVWQWPTAAGVPGLPNGKDEYYTTCSDISIAASQNRTRIPLTQQDPQPRAVANYRLRACPGNNTRSLSNVRPCVPKIPACRKIMTGTLTSNISNFFTNTNLC
jgi:hypothetical protein